MLDISEYRYAEAAAKAQIRSWWIAQTHHVDHFEKSGFPVRPSHFFEIGQLLDTMQENRFALFMSELGGLSDTDVELTLAALARCIEFQLVHFPRRKPVLPIATMISCLALYKKIMSACASPAILEVGPGCGYLSFFLGQEPMLKEYTQVEAAESFYLLQNRVNSHCFGSGFVDFAHQFERADYSFTSRTDFERGVALDDADLRRVKCTHFPWWMLGLLHSRAAKYDIVTSNANLNEFSRPALRDYLSIFRNVLKKDGLFLVQCTGFPAQGSLDDLFDHLFGFGFAPLFVALVGGVEAGSAASRLVFRDTTKQFALNNLVLVQEGHPWFARACDRRNYANGFAVEWDVLGAMFRNAPATKVYSATQLGELFLQVCAAGPEPGSAAAALEPKPVQPVSS